MARVTSGTLFKCQNRKTVPCSLFSHTDHFDHFPQHHSSPAAPKPGSTQIANTLHFPASARCRSLQFNRTHGIESGPNRRGGAGNIRHAPQQGRPDGDAVPEEAADGRLRGAVLYGAHRAVCAEGERTCTMHRGIKCTCGSAIQKERRLLDIHHPSSLAIREAATNIYSTTVASLQIILINLFPSPNNVTHHLQKAQRYCPHFPIYTSDLQERRSNKLRILRQRGKGPPKKGSGKRSK